MIQYFPTHLNFEKKQEKIIKIKINKTIQSIGKKILIFY